jgi:hypothetical protein
MGTLFPNDPAYPDYRPIPRLDVRPIVIVGMVGTVLVSQEPVIQVGHEHVPHQDLVDASRPALSYSISSTSGNHSVTPGAGSLTVTGWPPSVVVRSTQG